VARYARVTREDARWDLRKVASEDREGMYVDTLRLKVGAKKDPRSEECSEMSGMVECSEERGMVGFADLLDCSVWHPEGVM
jgi:hypothetical protein